MLATLIFQALKFTNKTFGNSQMHQTLILRYYFLLPSLITITIVPLFEEAIKYANLPPPSHFNEFLMCARRKFY